MQPSRRNARDTSEPRRHRALALAIGAPARHGAIGANRHGVRLAGRDIDDRAKARRDRALVGDVPSPAGHRSVRADRDIVECAGLHPRDTAESRWHDRLPKLGIGPGVGGSGTPADERTVGAERNRMRCTCGEPDDIAQAGRHVRFAELVRSPARHGAVGPQCCVVGRSGLEPEAGPAGDEGHRAKVGRRRALVRQVVAPLHERSIHEQGARTDQRCGDLSVPKQRSRRHRRLPSQVLPPAHRLPLGKSRR